jgi:hypothetical protein
MIYHVRAYSNTFFKGAQPPPRKKEFRKRQKEQFPGNMEAALISI